MMASGERVTFTKARKSICSWMHSGINRTDLTPRLPEIVKGAVTYSAYRRGYMIEKRRATMAAWSDFLARKAEPDPL